MEKVFIGPKDISRYITACFFALSKDDKIVLISRGNHIKRAIDVLAILIREHLDDAKYDIKVGSDSLDKRNVTTLEIVLEGKRRKNKKRED